MKLTSVSAQERFVNKAYSFSMLKPADWIERQNTELINNLKRYEIGSKALDDIIKQNQNSVALTSYYKYDPRAHGGLIPTINVLVRQNRIKNFDDFMSVITQSADGMKQIFNDMEYIKRPEVMVIDGVKSVYFVTKFTMKLADGTPIKVRNRNYAVPREGHFFQINFIDGSDSEDCSSIYDKLEKSIKLKDIQ
jgi:hypothetical protein